MLPGVSEFSFHSLPFSYSLPRDSKLLLKSSVEHGLGPLSKDSKSTGLDNEGKQETQHVCNVCLQPYSQTLAMQTHSPCACPLQRVQMLPQRFPEPSPQGSSDILHQGLRVGNSWRCPLHLGPGAWPNTDQNGGTSSVCHVLTAASEPSEAS